MGTEIGIKNPLIKLSYTGQLSLRNDRPDNIIIKEAKINKVPGNDKHYDELKTAGNEFLKKFDFVNGLRKFEEALNYV